MNEMRLPSSIRAVGWGIYNTDIAEGRLQGGTEISVKLHCIYAATSFIYLYPYTMKHGIKLRQLQRTPSHRYALLR
jgi:hypothetical protein